MKKRKENLFFDFCILVPCILLGIWMMLAPNSTGVTAHEEIEDASVSFMKDIWGIPAGLTLVIFGLLWIIPTIRNYKKTETQKEETLSRLIYRISFFILLICVMLYTIMILQNVCTTNGILSSKFAFSDIEDIHFVLIIFIIVFGISALISKLVSGKKGA